MYTVSSIRAQYITNLTHAFIPITIQAYVTIAVSTIGRSVKCEMQQLTERLRLEVEDETDELLVCNCDPAILVSVKLTERRRQRLRQKHHSHSA